LIAAARLNDIGQTRGEYAAAAEQLRVDVVSDLVRAHAQAAFGADERQAAEILLLDGVVEAEAHFVLAVGQLVHAARHERVRAFCLPGTKIDRIGLRHRRAARVDIRELAASLQILANDRADLLRRTRFIGEIGCRDRKLGRTDAGHEYVQLGVCGGAGCDQAGRDQRFQAKLRHQTHAV